MNQNNVFYNHNVGQNQTHDPNAGNYQQQPDPNQMTGNYQPQPQSPPSGLQLISSEERLPSKQPVIVLYGAPGIGKTSLALSWDAKRTILFDYSGGGKRADRRANVTIPMDGFNFGTEEQNQLIELRKENNIILIDGLNEMLLDCIKPALIEYDSSFDLEENRGKLWGAIAEEFIQHFKYLQSLDFSIVITCQECETPTRAGEDWARFEPCIAGKKTMSYILNYADLIGYIMQDASGERIADFNPSPSYIAKNCYQIPAFSIQYEEDGEDFQQSFNEFVISKIIDRNKKVVENAGNAELINGWEKSFLEIETIADFTLLCELLKKLPNDIQFLLSGSVQRAQEKVTKPVQMQPQGSAVYDNMIQTNLQPEGQPGNVQNINTPQDVILQYIDMIIGVVAGMNYEKPLTCEMLKTFTLMNGVAEQYGFSQVVFESLTCEEWEQKVLPAVNETIKQFAQRNAQQSENEGMLF